MRRAARRPAALTRIAGVALLALAALAGVGAAPAADTGWVIDRFQSDLTVEADGTLRVVEAIDVDFQALTDRHGIYREIPVEYRNDAQTVRVFELTVDGVTDAQGRRLAYETASHGANLQVKIGDANRTVAGKQTYRIAYRVRGALDAYPDHDELYWNVNGAEWPVPMRAVAATVTVAPGGLTKSACFEGPTGSTDACRLGPRSTTRAEFAASRALAPGEQLTIVAAVAKGVLPEPTPILRAKARAFEDWFALDAPRASAALLVLALGLALVGRTWWRLGRDDRGVRSDTVVAEYEPPDGLRPAQLGVLQDERADPLDATATLIDLAVRGHLVIEEIAPAGPFGLGTKDWKLSRTAADRRGLLAYELTLLQGLFDLLKTGPSVKLSEIRTHFVETLGTAQKELYKDATAHGWFAGSPDAVRTRWGVTAMVTILAGAALTAVLGLLVAGGLVGLAVMAAGLALAVASPFMPRRTAAGRELLRRTHGFKRYMEVAEKDRQRFAEKVSLFSEYLPYAIVFGCVDKWARAFKDLYSEPSTSSWYHGTSSLGAMALASTLQGFSSNVSSAIASRPGGSGGGFSGGSSGGGGGGGGGGSW